MPEAERDIILTSKKLERLTPQTITNPKRLLDELTRIRNLGYALSKGERNPDAFSLAAPVFERKDQLIGSLAIAGPISRFTPESEKIYLTDLMIAARTLSEQFSLKDNK